MQNSRSYDFRIQEYLDWFVTTHQVDPKKFSLVPLGALEPSFWQPNDQSNKLIGNVINVLYWGGFLRSHGVDCMVKAADLLRDKLNIRFEFVGSGPEREKTVALANELGLINAHFPGYLSNQELFNKIQEADICLGVFGKTQQSYLTIQNKIYECLSMGKPLISGISPLVERTFKQGQEIFLCERNPESLANAISLVSTSKELRDILSKNGRHLYELNYSPLAIGKIFTESLEKII